MHDRISLLNVGTCSLLHLRHLPSTAPRSNVALAAPAEGWRLSWLLLVFQFHIIFRLRAADRFFFQHKGKKENSQNFRAADPFFFQRKGKKENSQHLPTTPSESASSTPRAPAACASYCTYGTCYTCLLLHLRHLLLRLPHLLSTPAATPAAPAFNANDTCSACFLLEMLYFFIFHLHY